MRSGQILFLWEVATNHQDHAWIEDDVRVVLEEAGGSWTVSVLPTAGGWSITARQWSGSRAIQVSAVVGQAGLLEHELRRELGNGRSPKAQ